jgi:hypothetical protein
VRDRESNHLKSLILQDDPRLYLNEVNLDRRPSSSQYHAVDQIIHALERPTPTVDLQTLHRFPTGEGGYEPPQAQDVIKMTVGEEDAIEALESQPTAQNLPLCPFAAVDQETIIPVEHDLS